MNSIFEAILKAHTQTEYALHMNAADDEANDARRLEMERLLLVARNALQAAGVLGWAIGTMCPITDSFNSTLSIDAEAYFAKQIDYNTVDF